MKEAPMGIIVSFMGDLPVWYWLVAGLIGVFLVGLSFYDEIFVEEHNRALYIAFDPAVRLLIKVLAALAFALFWVIMAIPVGIAVLAFVVKEAVDFARTAWTRSVPKKPVPRYDFTHLGVVSSGKRNRS